MSEEPDQPTSHRSRSSRRWSAGVAAAVVVAAIGYAAVRLLDANGSGSPSAKASPTPLASMNLRGLPISRTSPCRRIDQHGVETALSGPVATTEHYAPGDRVQLGPGVRDVAQEYGCSYRDATGAEARVWVFSQPVTRGVASRLMRETRSTRGCRAVQVGPVFGSPAITTSCAVGRSRTVALRGLFGDAWLTCQLTVPPGDGGGDPVRRTQRWCVRVATGLGASG